METELAFRKVGRFRVMLPDMAYSDKPLESRQMWRSGI